VLSLQPDMGSLTLGSLNFTRQASINAPDTIHILLAEMNKYGVRPELECFDTGMINYGRYLIAKGLLEPPYYFNLIFGNISTAQADAIVAGLAVKELPEGAYWAMGGIGSDQLKMNALAIALGGGVRVGIEDNIWYDEARTIPATNIGLIRRIHQLAEIHGRKVMQPKAFGDLGFYNPNRFH
ncbi:MAG TPA: 3-keto-5-aminohexanoate cleavage protein, partial [Prolixibacteraceae bacterium]|nr:3-keto-5-aminohexanoate cleavage protein [Prolixibacteraceae bacterium]